LPFFEKQLQISDLKIGTKFVLLFAKIREGGKYIKFRKTLDFDFEYYAERNKTSTILENSVANYRHFARLCRIV